MQLFYYYFYQLLRPMQVRSKNTFFESSPLYFYTFYCHLDDLKIENLTVKHDGSCPVMAECEVKFAPDVTTDIKASWLLNGTEVKVESVQSTQDLGGETSYYFTRECNVTNFGNLTCRAQLVDDQRVISESNRTIEFIFPVQPKINSIEGATLNVTDSATLRCTAQGFPRPDIQWVFEERIIQPENGKIVIDYINDTTSASSSMILKNVERRDNGSYICEASNSYGRAVSTAVLYVHSRPEISIISALGISDDSLYLHWTLKNGNLPIMNYHVKY